MSCMDHQRGGRVSVVVMSAGWTGYRQEENPLIFGVIVGFTKEQAVWNIGSPLLRHSE